MTAVVGILNKQSVALAADSAVTITGPQGRKILNKANKLFALSKCHPVGVMLYNSATFMGIPWETIIKMYRRQIGSGFFPTVRAWQEDFIDFLRKKNWFTPPDVQDAFATAFFRSVLMLAIEDAAQKNRVLFAAAADPANHVAILNDLLLVLGDMRMYFEKQPVCPELAGISFAQFIKEYSPLYDTVIIEQFGDLATLLTAPQRDEIAETIWRVFVASETLTSFTGLIFSGYGEEEIYPQLIPLNISFAGNGMLRYHEDVSKTVSITHHQGGGIADFAQTDVIRTILTGVDPWLDQLHQKNFEDLFSKFRDQLILDFGGGQPALTAALEHLDLAALAKAYQKMNIEAQHQKYIDPLLGALDSLSKEDLAEMAESLIYLTYLKRRITSAEESVGGPVDVAIISKGDGFVWIKRKHYFAPELNRPFFDNYFKP